MRKHQLSLFILALLAATSLVIGQSGQENKGGSASGAQGAHIMVTPDQVKWGPGPPSLPPGAQLAVLEGDPSKAGSSFAIRAKMPDGYKVPPHWHPTDERIVVLQGTLGMGTGEKFDPASGHELPAGSYSVMPTAVRHFVWAKGETVIQVSGMGPFEVNYVNPADDPRKTTNKQD
jgi:Domain of unknown function (DUF4437)